MATRRGGAAAGTVAAGQDISNPRLFHGARRSRTPDPAHSQINAVVPVPGKSFQEAFDFKEVFAA